MLCKGAADLLEARPSRGSDQYLRDILDTVLSLMPTSDLTVGKSRRLYLQVYPDVQNPVTSVPLQFDSTAQSHDVSQPPVLSASTLAHQ